MADTLIALLFSRRPAPTAGPATFSLRPAGGGASAEVVDVLGRRVRVLAVKQVQPAGLHTLAVPALYPGLNPAQLIYTGRAAYRKPVVE